MLQIDGSKGEGGGAIVRQALALSALTGKPFEVINIRKNRPTPGLKSQHLHGVNALQRLCDAKVSGNQLGSESLQFVPNKLKSSELHIDIGTAGSITLLLQSLILPIALSPVKVKLKIRGGTDVAWSPSIDYFSHVFLPAIRCFCNASLKVLKRGYYPVGGGEVEVELEGRTWDGKQFIGLNQGKLELVKGVAHASVELESSRVADRMAKTAEMICSSLHVPVQMRVEYLKTSSTGCGLTIWAIGGELDTQGLQNKIVLGSDGLGEKGKKAEDVGREVAERLIQEVRSEAPIDRFLADQLIPFLAYTGGEIRVSSISQHVWSNIYVAQEFLGVSFSVSERVIKCETVTGEVGKI